MGLHGSVGLGGRNWRPDVARVQGMLTLLHMAPGPIDGRCGRRTIEAIELFQQHVLRRPDGRIDVTGPTWRKLEYQAQQATMAAHDVARARHRTGSAGSRPPVAARAVTSSVRAPSPRTTAPTSMLSSRAVGRAPVIPVAPVTRGNGENFWCARTSLPAPGTVNRGLSCPTSAQMEQIFGDPHRGETSGRLKRGRFGSDPVTALGSALVSLDSILARVRQDLPDLHALLGTAGAYNLRNIRGRNCYSNHSWGTAIDVKVGGMLIPLGAAYSCRGLDALCIYFNEAGWYWGGGYHHRKDCMHFETGLALARSFA